MKHKRHMSDAAIAANRENAKASTGARTKEGKERASHNSWRHGILATTTNVRTHKDRTEFRRIRRLWTKEFDPHGTLEKFFVEEVTGLSWRLGITEEVEIRELLRRRNTAEDANSEQALDDKIELPVDEWELPVNRGWECEQVIVRAVSGDEEGDTDNTKMRAAAAGTIATKAENVSGNRKHHAQQIEVQALMGSSLDTVSRYRSGLKRELYRAIDKLVKMREEQG